MMRLNEYLSSITLKSSQNLLLESKLGKDLKRSKTIPRCFLDTSLTQIWKKKGSALDLNNMRFIHTRHWRSKLIEALVTEKMKDNIVQATPKIQLGGMPGAASVEHLVVLKTWMKYKEEKKEGGILCTYDMSKFLAADSSSSSPKVVCLSVVCL